jgi:exopolysaccharide production protein ExoQ
MPSELALLLYFIFVSYLFWTDTKRRTNVSNALWVPLIWMTIMGSRLVSQWLGFGVTAGSVEEGNPVDATVLSLLIGAGIFILARRRVTLLRIVRDNPWLSLFLLYCGVSILWSDFPFVAFKRWVKEIGHLVMILVVLTEDEPVEAAKALIRRFSYVLIPLSVILIKYYTYLGIQYSYWSGAQSYVGVTTSKNMLGNLCLVSGLFFFWSLFTMWRNKARSMDKHDLFIHVVFLAMIWWLLTLASSATSLMCLGIGICIIAGFELPAMRKSPRTRAFVIVSSLLLFFLLEEVFDLSQVIIASLGRDPTFTGRSEIWNEVISLVPNPLIGTGYDSFWLGERLKQMWAKHWWNPTGSHNGYLETYINLGWIGLVLLCLLILAIFRKIQRESMSDYDYGRFEMALLIIGLVYNITEVAFKGTMLIWFMLILIAVKAPARPAERAEFRISTSSPALP